MQGLITDLQDNEERLHHDLAEREDELAFCRSQFKQSRDYSDALDLKLLELSRLQDDMTAELSTMQRVTDTLKQDNQRLQHKCELATDLANQRMQEIGGMRRQLGEVATVQYELEQLREEKRMLEGERD